MVLLFYGRCTYQIKNEEGDAKGIIMESHFVWTGKYVKYIRTIKTIMIYGTFEQEAPNIIIGSDYLIPEIEQ